MRMAILAGIYQFGKWRGRIIDRCKVKLGFRNGYFRNGEMAQDTILRVANTIAGCPLGGGGSNTGKLREIENSSI